LNNSISVIVPVFNRESLISTTLNSLLNQTLPAGEIIVVDDGSTDSTVASVKKTFAIFNQREKAKNKKITLKILSQKNAGPGSARNRGFLESKGEFIHFFDSDDIAARNKHEVQLEVLQKNNADIAYCPWVKGRFQKVKKREQDQIEFIPEGYILQLKGLPQGNLIQELLTRWSVVPHACLFRRSIVEKVGGFPVDLFGTEDQLMFLRCLLFGARVIHTPGTLEFYRTGNDLKITGSGFPTRLHNLEWAKFLVLAKRECLKNGINPLRWSKFRMRCWLACRALENNKKEYFHIYQELTSFLKKTDKPFFYLFSLFHRIQGGISQRVRGHRANKSFCCGRFTRSDAALLPFPLT